MRPILVLADDDADHSSLLTMWLERHGYRVLSFESGDDLVAWALQSSNSADAFLLDLEMPGRDGLASCSELRGIPIHAATPAVLVSGARMDGIAERADAAGVNAIVPKDENMLQRLHDWLRSNLPRVETALA